MTDRSPAATKIGDLAAVAGIRHVHVVAWRDLDDVEAGGSELHAANVCREWAEAGLHITCRTSYAAGHPPDVVRDGYEVERRAGRYLVFPRAAVSAIAGRQGRPDALVEIWNGMPFLSPLWSRVPRLTFVHHVHGAMWRMVLPRRLAAMGETMERSIAPRIYRRSQIVTLSNSSKRELVEELGFDDDRVAVVPPGVDARFTPGGARASAPTLVAVGRLVPPKRVDELIRAAAEARRSVPDLRLEIVGEGFEHVTLEALIADLGADDWVELVGRCSDDELVRRYRRAWILASASSHEGWGMSVTEAAACATPAVVTDIAGHRDAVVNGVTGLLCDTPADLAPALVELLTDHERRERFGAAARERAAELTWPETATSLMRLLAAESHRRTR
ncbi:MAG: glycosyltransferase family 4 protein [Acidimicrobiales bacterium]|nr:glycosyltransferase family 4 protein [Acidimicrobiales bacterium]